MAAPSSLSQSQALADDQLIERQVSTLNGRLCFLSRVELEIRIERLTRGLEQLSLAQAAHRQAEPLLAQFQALTARDDDGSAYFPGYGFTLLPQRESESDTAVTRWRLGVLVDAMDWSRYAKQKLGLSWTAILSKLQQASDEWQSYVAWRSSLRASPPGTPFAPRDLTRCPKLDRCPNKVPRPEPKGQKEKIKCCSYRAGDERLTLQERLDRTHAAHDHLQQRTDATKCAECGSDILSLMRVPLRLEAMERGGGEPLMPVYHQAEMCPHATLRLIPKAHMSSAQAAVSLECWRAVFATWNLLEQQLSSRTSDGQRIGAVLDLSIMLGSWQHKDVQPQPSPVADAARTPPHAQIHFSLTLGAIERCEQLSPEHAQQKGQEATEQQPFKPLIGHSAYANDSKYLKEAIMEIRKLVSDRRLQQRRLQELAPRQQQQQQQQQQPPSAASSQHVQRQASSEPAQASSWRPLLAPQQRSWRQ